MKTMNKRRIRKDEGFSLLEMVVAMGILIVLVVGGILVYSGINQNAKDGAVAQAAKSVYTGAVSNQSDNDGSTTAQSAAKEYNDSQDSTVTVDGVERPMIYTTVEELEDGLRVTAIYGDDEAKHVIGGDGEAVTPNPDTNPAVVVSYQCDFHARGSLMYHQSRFEWNPELLASDNVQETYEREWGAFLDDHEKQNPEAMANENSARFDQFGMDNEEEYMNLLMDVSGYTQSFVNTLDMNNVGSDENIAKYKEYSKEIDVMIMDSASFFCGK